MNANYSVFNVFLTTPNRMKIDTKIKKLQVFKVLNGQSVSQTFLLSQYYKMAEKLDHFLIVKKS